MSCAIEVLTLADTSQPIGYRLGGADGGPNIAVLGHGNSVSAACEWLLHASFMRLFNGSLTLLSLDELPDMQSQTLREAIRSPNVDHVILLPNAASSDDIAMEGYAAILDACEKLGMTAVAA